MNDNITPDVSREGFIGRTDDGEAVYVRIQVTTGHGRELTVTHETSTSQTRVSITGRTFRKGSRRKDADTGGQIAGTLRRVTKPEPEFTAADVARLADLWDRWHLNDMRAACAHQTPAAVPEHVSALNSAAYVLDNTPPCPQTGYKYGSAWLYEPVPADVIAELAALAANLDGTDGFR